MNFAYDAPESLFEYEVRAHVAMYDWTVYISAVGGGEPGKAYGNAWWHYVAINQRTGEAYEGSDLSTGAFPHTHLDAASIVVDYFKDDE